MKIVIIIAVLIVGLIIVMLSQRRSKSSNTQSGSEPKKEQIDMSNSIFYHEDDYRQVEIIPDENFSELIKQAENVQDFAEKHFDGGGYTDMMVREENGFKLKQRGIKTRELDLILSELPIKRYTEVSTGIRPGEMTSKNTFGYGENYNGIFFDFESDSVTGIWVAGSPSVENEEFAQALNNIGNKWSLLLMDWNSLELIDLKDKEQIEKYLN
ncbi:hypothetical protein [Roseivirga sp. E12]|uniref:hypothetical protein n=1 Tax=Roseivirga sp. E12 TaxID=2819237 RepID=UPI001ABC241C|nr:hypothetical protein [Roseivirga sp. E12]MBO3697721.1 hypothetical protein [Roseivirga sp. E12]